MLQKFCPITVHALIAVNVGGDGDFEKPVFIVGHVAGWHLFTIFMR